MTGVAQAPPPIADPASSTRRRRIGTSELQVFPLAISGNVFGWTASATDTEDVLDAYWRLGGNFVDTADAYAGGRSEVMIGNWMRDRCNRGEMVVATKVGKGADSPGVTQRAITRSVNSSLERLGTDHIDLLYLHIDDATVPFEETLLAVDALVSAGKVRYFGASDHTENRLVEARVISAQLGATPMTALQSHYNLIHRRPFEGTLARVAREQGLGVMPRFALESGFLSGKYRSRADLASQPRGREASVHLNKRGLRILGVLDEVALHHAVVPATVALAWLLSRPNVVAPVVSASRVGQVAQLMAAASVVLTRAQVSELERVSAA
ncbi:MAG: aldo/keto reductase [Burkholderiaceae bacterium]|nr:aldo/keto reductase [Microbacteriaceae bacterium]